MNHPQVAQYGTWSSPISPDDLAAGSLHLDQVYISKSNGLIYLVEVRPNEDGRCAIVEYRDGVARDVLPAKYSAMTRVYEYGGGSMIPRESDSHLIFSDFESKTVFDLDPVTQEVKPIVSEDRQIWFADFDVHPVDSKWVLAIWENHHAEKIEEVENNVVAINSDTKEIQILARGEDFYSQPRFSPDGTQLFWLQWKHPNMPWNHTQLWVASWRDGMVIDEHPIAGFQQDCSISQPIWSPDGSIFFVDDKTGYWQLYHIQGDSTKHLQLKGLEKAEFSEPEWWLAGQTYVALTSATLLAFYNMDGAKKAIQIDVHSCEWKDVGCPLNEVMFNAMKRVTDTSVAVLGATPTSPKSFYLMDIAAGCEMTLLKSSVTNHFHRLTARLREASPFHEHTAEEAASLTVYSIHRQTQNIKLQTARYHLLYWLCMEDQHGTKAPAYTCVIRRGQLGGSSGYGRDYMQLLDEQWGVSDIADAASCVEYLVKERLIDAKRVGITGHSAGGYACMQGMAVYPELWAAGIAESGISDIATMLSDTHKFESRYFEPLCWSSDTSDADKARIIKERSPIEHAEKIKAPMLILSGEDDNIVPPDQATKMEKRIRETGTAVELKTYPGEGHIFSKASTLKDMEVRRFRWFRKYLVDEIA